MHPLIIQYWDVMSLLIKKRIEKDIYSMDERDFKTRRRKANRASDTFCGHCLQAIAVS